MNDDQRNMIAKEIKQRYDANAPPATIRFLAKRYRVSQYEIEELFTLPDYHLNPGYLLEGKWVAHRRQGDKTLEYKRSTPDITTSNVTTSNRDR